jgi:hypothetical protein
MPATKPAIIEIETRSAREAVDITTRVEARLDGAKGGSRLLSSHAAPGSGPGPLDVRSLPADSRRIRETRRA